MSNLYKWCCCGAQGDPCAGACECDSSYIMNGLSGSLGWQFTGYQGTPCSNLCWDYDSGGHRNSHSLQMTFTQGQTTALAKVAGTCCYRAYGELFVSYDYTFSQIITCCQNLTPKVCTWQEQKFGNKTLDFCYTVVCQPNVLNGGPGWVHSLSICGFCVGNIQVSGSPTGNECADPDLCDSLPLGRYGLCFGGGTYRWVTALKCLDTIQRPSDVHEQGPCGGFSNCEESGDLCLEPQIFQSGAMGPFSPYTVAEFTTANPQPDDCAEVSATSSQETIVVNCIGHKDVCTGAYDYSSDCCEATFTYGFSLPYFV